MSGYATAQKPSMDHDSRNSYYPPHFDFNKTGPSHPHRSLNNNNHTPSEIPPSSSRTEPKQGAARSHATTKERSSQESSQGSSRKQGPTSRPSFDSPPSPASTPLVARPADKRAEAELSLGRETRHQPPILARFPDIGTLREIDEATSTERLPEQEKTPGRDQSLAQRPHTEAQTSAREQYAMARAASYNPTEEIYVLGTDIRGCFMAHAIGSCSTLPPVRLLLHNRKTSQNWEESGQRIDLYRGDEILSQTRIIGEPASLVYRSRRGANLMLDPRIDNLIVTLPAAGVVRAFENIAHRIDQWSTVCLVQDGLGIVEELVETYFPNPLQRPLFLLGHLSHRLGHVGERHEKTFNLAQIRPGRTYFTIYSTDKQQQQLDPGAAARQGRTRTPTMIKRHPPVEQTVRGTHMLRLLSATPELQAAAVPWGDWLQQKLPTMVFHAVADTLSTALDTPFDEIPGNAYAMQMVDHMLGEIFATVARLPETRDWKRSARLRQASAMRGWLVEELARRKSLSLMHRKTKLGWESDVDYELGWFVRRAREVGVPCHSLSTVLWLVKAKHADNLRRHRLEVPFEWFAEAVAKRQRMREDTTA